ncbi:sigma-54 dependent transcriptional regulator [Lishizhenia sp.]|uniref:sigma-54-dependent transcriptional regulator n=1 Tax=Lishizhenia sp. TaxID=2497594 RepID=UPI00299F14FF|nr:sigma-54 dependent transcriptional regulator [Lishizhenia sp.]MDX1446757.1 sigma-54 dependent transcriptional regulator [Lishizhenia sp.]
MSQKHPEKIALFDDDENILIALKLLLQKHYAKVSMFSVQEELIAALESEEYDVLMMDMNYSKGEISGAEGLAFLKVLVGKFPALSIVVMTAFSEINLAVESMKIGAKDFVKKPWENARLLKTLEQVVQLKSTTQQLQKVKAVQRMDFVENAAELDFGMIGDSQIMRDLKATIAQVAETDANVLVLGENGTGKELVAKALHAASLRKEEAFVKIDLGTVHEQLFEAELFGAKKGAYTGLNMDKEGRMILADKGTLFLDEIGNLSLPLQAKMLSVLQNREVIAVGDTKAKKIDVRLIAATNMPLEELLDGGKFRQDLLYRINTVEIVLPPLRERREDVDDLLHFFKQKFVRKYKKQGVEFSSQAIDEARSYSWPGNVRELEHAVERAVVLAKDGVIYASDLVNAAKKDMYTGPGVLANLNLQEMEIALINEALKVHRGNMTKAAKDLGLTRAALYRRLDKYDL